MAHFNPFRVASVLAAESRVERSSLGPGAFIQSIAHCPVGHMQA